MNQIYLLILLMLLKGGAHEDCMLDEKSMQSSWSTASQWSAPEGAVTFLVERCPGVSTVRVVADDILVFKAEAGSPISPLHLQFMANQAPVIPAEFHQTYPVNGTVQLEAGVAYNLYYSGETLDQGEARFTLSESPGRLVIDEDAVRISVGPGMYTALDLQTASGDTVWSYVFGQPVSGLSLHLVRGENTPDTMRVAIGGYPLTLDTEPFVLLPAWYELSATGPTNTFALYFSVP